MVETKCLVEKVCPSLFLSRFLPPSGRNIREGEQVAYPSRRRPSRVMSDGRRITLSPPRLDAPRHRLCCGEWRPLKSLFTKEGKMMTSVADAPSPASTGGFFM